MAILKDAVDKPTGEDSPYLPDDDLPGEGASCWDLFGGGARRARHEDLTWLRLSRRIGRIRSSSLPCQILVLPNQGGEQHEN